MSPLPLIVPKYPTATVGIDLPCTRCGYNLRTLGGDGRCPECGLDVQASVAASYSARGRAGVHLKLANPGWVRSLRDGLLLYILAALAICLSATHLLDHVLFAGSRQSLGMALLRCLQQWGPPIVACWGAWKLGRKEPGCGARSGARLLRASVLVYAIAVSLQPVAWAAESAGATSLVFVHPVQWLAAALGTWWILSRLIELSTRVPSRSLKWQGEGLKWFMATLFLLQVASALLGQVFVLRLLEQWNPMPGMGEAVMQRGERNYMLFLDLPWSGRIFVMIYRIVSVWCVVFVVSVLVALFRATQERDGESASRMRPIDGGRGETS